MKTNYETRLINALKSCITEQKKLRTYSEFKTVIKFENYPDIIRNQQIRFNLTRFRLGADDLEIEKDDTNAIPYLKNFAYANFAETSRSKQLKMKNTFYCTVQCIIHLDTIYSEILQPNRAIF